MAITGSTFHGGMSRVDDKCLITGGTFNCGISCREQMMINGGMFTGHLSVDGKDGELTINNITMKTTIKAD